MDTVYMRLIGEIHPEISVDQIHKVTPHTLRIVPSNNQTGYYIYIENYMSDDLAWYVTRIIRLSFHASRETASSPLES